MSPRNARFPALACLPALVVSLGLSLPAHAAEPSTTPQPAAAAASPDAPSLDLQLRAAKRVRNTGIGTLALGTLMLGVGGGLEHKRRTNVCDEIGSEEHRDACDRSKMANITVLAMGVTMFVGGAVLLGLGQTKLARARRAMASRGLSVAPQVGRGFAGAMFSARF